LGSLNELLEDYFELEKDCKEGQRKTKKDKKAALVVISRIIKLLMGEKTMLVNQIEGLKKKYIREGDERENLNRRRNQEKKKQIVRNYNWRNW